MNILYVHGLSSSGHSHTVATIRGLLPEDNVYSPDLPLDPVKALDLLRKAVEKWQVDLVIGTSMGGMFAQKLRGTTKILVNPAFHVSEFMRRNIGVCDFLNPREDGVMKFEITADLCDKYERLEACQFDGLETSERENTFGLFGLKDDLIDCRLEYQKYYKNYSTFDGGHRLDESTVRLYLLPLIEKLRRQSHPTSR